MKFCSQCLQKKALPLFLENYQYLLLHKLYIRKRCRLIMPKYDLKQEQQLQFCLTLHYKLSSKQRYRMSPRLRNQDQRCFQLLLHLQYVQAHQLQQFLCLVLLRKPSSKQRYHMSLLLYKQQLIRFLLLQQQVYVHLQEFLLEQL